MAVLSLQPTFTQGLILGQLSIIVLLVFILKYLFLDSTAHPFETFSYYPRVDSDHSSRSRVDLSQRTDEGNLDRVAESAEWFNVLLRQVTDRRHH
jgi:maintenance of morphology protein 1